jgi:hypothetical protein
MRWPRVFHIWSGSSPSLRPVLSACGLGTSSSSATAGGSSDRDDELDFALWCGLAPGTGPCTALFRFAACPVGSASTRNRSSPRELAAGAS